MDSPILSFDQLLSDEECLAPFQIPDHDVPLDSQMNSPSHEQGLSDMDLVSTSPTQNSEIYGGPDSLSVASPSSPRNSIDDLSLLPSSAFRYRVDQDYIDFTLGKTSDAIAPSWDESPPRVSDSCLPDSSQKVPVKRSRHARHSARSTMKINEDSLSSPVACANERESVAVESNTSGASAVSLSGNGLPNVKIVKVIKSSGSGNSTEDVLKALDDKNRKNAQLARSNCAKKKVYVQGLEEQVKNLTEEKTGMQKAIEEKDDKIRELEGEVEYLRSVLLNDSALAGLLKTIDRRCELQSSGGSRKRGSDGDQDNTASHKRPRRPSSVRGVCLHVTADSASLEFCPDCSSKSAAEGN